MCLVPLTKLKVTFVQDEHTPWLQALNELSDSRRIIRYLKLMGVSGHIAF